MKNLLFMLLAVTVVTFNSCSDEAVALYGNENIDSSANLMGGKGAPLNVNLSPFNGQLEDADGNMPVDDATLLYNKNGGQHVPIMTPDGLHQVTYGEFKMASGMAKIKCINAGTHVVMQLKGLIPHGVYSLWTLIFEAPGFDGTMNNRIGFGALGAIEGNKNSNSFIADDEGNASISIIRAAGKLEVDGSVNPEPDYEGVPNCLSEEFETHLALAYHLNNIAAGPGAPPTWVVQGAFIFFGSQL